MAISFKDTATRHQVFIERYGAGLGNRFHKEMAKTYKRIQQLLLDVNPETARAAQLRQLQLDAEQMLSTGYKKASTDLILELNDLANNEAKWAQSLILQGSSAVAPVLPSPQQIRAAYTTKKFEASPRSRVDLEQAINNLGSKQSARARTAISDGFLLGETNEQIAKRIAQEEIISRAQARTLARTATNHVANVSRTETYAGNRDIVQEYEWVATLDSRTTLVCASRDGKRYPVTGDNPRPPAHYNCRSTTVPLIDPKYDLGAKVKGERPQVGAKGAGTTSAKTTFGSWLNKQPASFQDEYFSKFTDGPEKAKLFRKGKLKIDKFVDANGAEYNLDQLKALNPIEFDNSGL